MERWVSRTDISAAVKISNVFEILVMRRLIEELKIIS
jgi:hypothetical protein